MPTITREGRLVTFAHKQWRKCFYLFNRSIEIEINFLGIVLSSILVFVALLWRLLFLFSTSHVALTLCIVCGVVRMWMVLCCVRSLSGAHGVSTAKRWLICVLLTCMCECKRAPLSVCVCLVSAALSHFFSLSCSQQCHAQIDAVCQRSRC